MWNRTPGYYPTPEMGSVGPTRVVGGLGQGRRRESRDPAALPPTPFVPTLRPDTRGPVPPSSSSSNRLRVGRWNTWCNTGVGVPGRFPETYTDCGTGAGRGGRRGAPGRSRVEDPKEERRRARTTRGPDRYVWSRTLGLSFSGVGRGL